MRPTETPTLDEMVTLGPAGARVLFFGRSDRTGLAWLATALAERRIVLTEAGQALRPGPLTCTDGDGIGVMIRFPRCIATLRLRSRPRPTRRFRRAVRWQPQPLTSWAIRRPGSMITHDGRRPSAVASHIESTRGESTWIDSQYRTAPAAGGHAAACGRQLLHGRRFAEQPTDLLAFEVLEALRRPVNAWERAQADRTAKSPTATDSDRNCA